MKWFVQASDWDPCLELGEESQINLLNLCQDLESTFLWLATISGSTIHKGFESEKVKKKGL